LLDVYPDEERSLVLWLIGENGERYCFHQPFPVTFFIAGPFGRLREAWRYLQSQPIAAPFVGKDGPTVAALRRPLCAPALAALDDRVVA
jgi:hypothetical protein